VLGRLQGRLPALAPPTLEMQQGFRQQEAHRQAGDPLQYLYRSVLDLVSDLAVLSSDECAPTTISSLTRIWTLNTGSVNQTLHLGNASISDPYFFAQ
jgi:hypothetical protein